MSDPRSPEFNAEGRLWSPRYGDIYRGGGTPSADWDEVDVFLDGNDLPARFAALSAGATFTVGETGFGTGLSFLRTAALFLECAPASCRLHFVSVEAHPLSIELLQRAHEPHSSVASLARELRASFPRPASGAESAVDPLRPLRRIALDSGRVVLFLLLGDAEALLPAHPFAADAWFLDGFAPSRNPAMWSPTTLRAVAASTAAGGTLATWSVSAAVRRCLSESGFEVERRPGAQRKRQVLAGRLGSGRLVSSAARSNSYFRLDPRREGPRPRPSHVAIVGDGLAAASTARALADRGVDVSLVVPSDAGRAPGASSLPFGVMQPRLWNGNVPDAEWIAHAFAWTHALLSENPDCADAARWRQTGVLHLVLDPASETRARGRVAHTAQVLPTAWRDPDACRELFDGDLAEPHFGGSWIPQAGCFVPSLLATFLTQHPRIQKVTATPPSADAVVIAAGAASSGLLPPALSIRPVSGQLTRVIASSDAAASSARTQPVVCTNGHVSPAWGDGELGQGVRYLGSSYHDPAPSLHPQLSTADDADNLSRAVRVFPAFADLAVADGWAGVRGVTVDRLPMVGAVPDPTAFEAIFGKFVRGGPPPDEDAAAELFGETRLYAQAGHGSRGLATAPFSGELLAALLCGEPLPLSESLFDRCAPARAFVRSLRGPSRQKG